MGKIPRVLLAIVFALSFCGALLWQHFGTDFCLPVLADLTPILLAIVGVIMSYIQPKKESHVITTIVLVVAGLMGSAVLSVNRIRSEAAHLKEVGQLNVKLDKTGQQNTDLSNSFSSFIQRAYSGQITEVERRGGIEKILRNRYILSHDPIDPEILAGTAPLPKDWENAQLKAMGETWTVSEPKKSAQQATTIIQQTAPEPKKAQISFSFYQDLVGKDNLTTTAEVAPKDDEFEVSIAAVNTGDASAENLQIWIRCNGCTWEGDPPSGFAAPDTDKPYDRTISISDFSQNVSSPKWTFRFKKQVFPKYTAFKIGCYFACKNCPPVDWNKPQFLVVTEPNSVKRLFPSTSYIPAQGHQ
jgi:hypothetical protein